MTAFRPDHQDRGELHGMTVVVETDDGRALVGRFHEEKNGHVLMLDVDIHTGAEGEPSREEFLKNARAFGIWPKHARLEVPAASVASLRRLTDLAAG